MKPIVLLVLDGWGVREDTKHNAVEAANLPRYKGFLKDYPWTTLEASGKAVGLMPGVMGNSEVGHMNIGAGRVVYQTLTRIFADIESGKFFDNEALVGAIQACKKNDSALHCMGLLSDAGVHSHLAHLEALVELAKQHDLKQVYIHAFMDGRDTSPKSGASYLRHLKTTLKKMGTGKIVSLSGRYYAMDRDKRWERTEKAYRALVTGDGKRSERAPEDILEDWYATPNPEPGFGDEFLPPTVLVDPETHEPLATIQDNDAVIFFNFRPDRARQLTRALTDKDFSEFARPKTPKISNFVCMAPYSDTFSLPVAYPKMSLKKILPEIIAAQGIKQYRVAETEKYAHVTYFFNGGEEETFEGEERKLVASNREVATYDLAPEMRAREITAEVINCLKQDRYGFYVINFANPDMVGHTGKEDSVIQALETIDDCLGRIADQVLAKYGTLLITADHGNCEEMVDAEGTPHTQHTLNPVPLLLIGKAVKGIRLKAGRLCDVAPTILQLMEIEQPKEMTGKSLIQ